ncbi:KptA family-domain-containing protein [Pholiota molesta]|nr:KptA family-domain-containing protein [Pholiota molesta]
MSSSIPSDMLASLSLADHTTPGAASTRPSSSSRPPPTTNLGHSKKATKPKVKAQSGSEPNALPGAGGKKPAPKPKPSSSTKLRGLEKDLPEVRISKTLSWLLRHGAQSEGLPMRSDGYVKVVDLLNHPKLKAQGLDLERIKGMVKVDPKQRYDLILESPEGLKLEVVGAPVVATLPSEPGQSTPPSLSVGVSATAASMVTDIGKESIWWIKARQGHSIKTVKLELKPILSVSDIPTGVAVHGTDLEAWAAIAKNGLSKMKRNHIHLAQNVPGSGVISGIRSSAKVLIYVDVQKAIEAGIEFWLSENGVVLTEGNEKGFLLPRFFDKVLDSKGSEIKGWKKEETL